MAISYQVENRGLYFSDASGNTHLGHQVTIEESLSTPFLIQGILVSNNFSTEDQLGQLITCHWNEVADNKQKEKRVFNGYLTEIQLLESQSDHEYQRYQITLRPWLWLLTLRKNSQVFQQVTLSAILTSIFNDAGFSGNYTLGTLPSDERNYCVQYNETDFDFVQRLLAEQGIHYYFTHNNKSHQLTLHDPNSPYEKATISKLEYIASRTGEQLLLKKWQPILKVHSASISTVNYDYESTKLIDSGDTKSSNKIANNTKLTQYEFGTNSIKGDMSDLTSDTAKIRLNQVQSDYSSVEAESIVEDITLATQFSLSAHPDSKQLGDYAIESITHSIEAAEQSVKYHNNFICRPISSPSFPQPITKPAINGLQSAVVIGGDVGQPQHDVSGRIKVQFYWDKVGGDSPSCWIRVAQTMASASLGMQFIPRIGDEVLVSFVNNDPDQPVVIGSVYNSKNKPPYPEVNSSQSGIKTQLGKLANEIRFDDKTDKEQLYFHAAKDHVVEVENNFTQTVTAEFSSTTEKAIAIIGKDDYSLSVTKTLSETAKEISIEADDKITLAVGGNSIELSSSGITITCDKLTIKSSGDIAASGANVKISSTADTKISAGANLKGSATAKLSLAGTAGTEISSTAQVKISGTAGAELSSTALTKVSSSGITQISGSLVQVN